MKSVGEVMAIGRTFAESLQKALRGLETGLTGLDEIEIPGLGQGDDRNAIRAALGTPTPDRLRMVAQAFRAGLDASTRSTISLQDRPVVPRADRGDHRTWKRAFASTACRAMQQNLRMLKAMGFSDARLGSLTGKDAKRRRRTAR